jgi:hypothetical protein
MRSLTELPVDALQVAHDAAETVLRFRAYLPPGGLLVMLAGKFRDDIRDAREMEPLPRAYRGRDRLTLDELTSIELDTLAGAVGILLQRRFTDAMDDPELSAQLLGLSDALDEQKAERAQIRASIGRS